MRLETRKLLYDIQDAANLAAQFTSDKTIKDYETDPMLRFAVERAFSIIGEALAQLARVDTAALEEISESRRIIAFRNILIHAYSQTDDRIVWDVVESKLPSLIRQVARLMDNAEELP